MSPLRPLSTRAPERRRSVLYAIAGLVTGVGTALVVSTCAADLFGSKADPAGVLRG
jgi:hypothetical protein